MALRVEVAAFGICRTMEPYSLFVVCVQQEKFEAWVVYRRFNTFQLLREQLVALQPGIPELENVNTDDLNLDSLEKCRDMLDQWLKLVASNTMILRMQSMYQFLCVDANMPPPYLELHWKDSSNDMDEMEMDDLFDKPLDDDDDDDHWEDDDDDVDNSGEIRNSEQLQTVFNMTNSQVNNSNEIQSGNMNMGRPPTHEQNKMKNQVEENDGMDIQSLSVMEAEFIFDKMDEGKTNVETSKTKRTISLEAFKIIKVIGKGSFGKVFLVRQKSTSKLYAMKVLKKDYIIRKNQVEHTKTERSVLGYVHHPYIVGLNMAFQTSDKLFFVLDYCSGGELFFHLGKVGCFQENRSKFYAAQIILALEYVHKMDVIYRDLKPENVLLDDLGNVRLTDFGLSKEGVSDHSSGANSFCGTPEYIAPEVLLRQGHGRAVDWWSLGALLYEMITGLPPFYSRNRETMFEKIIKADLSFPAHVSEAAKDLLSHLLVRDPKARLGSGERDADEIKEHLFFSDIDWAEMSTGKMRPPWQPTVAGSLDTSQFDEQFTSMMPIVSPDVRGAYFGSLEKAFEGFTFVDDTAAQLMSNRGKLGATPVGSYSSTTAMRRASRDGGSKGNKTGRR